MGHGNHCSGPPVIYSHLTSPTIRLQARLLFLLTRAQMREKVFHVDEMNFGLKMVEVSGNV